MSKKKDIVAGIVVFVLALLFIHDGLIYFTSICNDPVTELSIFISLVLGIFIGGFRFFKEKLNNQGFRKKVISVLGVVVTLVIISFVAYSIIFSSVDSVNEVTRREISHYQDEPFSARVIVTGGCDPGGTGKIMDIGGGDEITIFNKTEVTLKKGDYIRAKGCVSVGVYKNTNTEVPAIDLYEVEFITPKDES